MGMGYVIRQNSHNLRTNSPHFVSSQPPCSPLSAPLSASSLASPTFVRSIPLLSSSTPPITYPPHPPPRPCTRSRTTPRQSHIYHPRGRVHTSSQNLTHPIHLTRFPRVLILLPPRISTLVPRPHLAQPARYSIRTVRVQCPIKKPALGKVRHSGTPRLLERRAVWRAESVSWMQAPKRASSNLSLIKLGRGENSRG